MRLYTSLQCVVNRNTMDAYVYTTISGVIIMRLFVAFDITRVLYS